MNGNTIIIIIMVHLVDMDGNTSGQSKPRPIRREFCCVQWFGSRLIIVVKVVMKVMKVMMLMKMIVLPIPGKNATLCFNDYEIDDQNVI